MPIGAYLKRERELREVSLERVSEVTRIPRSTLEHLEADDLERLPGRAYVVGYLRAYASVVGLDVDEVLLRYQEETGEVAAMAPAPAPASKPWYRRPTAGLVAGAVAVLIAVAWALAG